MNFKCNKLIVGLTVGILVPIIMAILLYLLVYKGHSTPDEFLSRLLMIDGLGKFLSISVLPNLLVFFVAISKEKLLAARGIVTATLLYAAVVLMVKFMF
ncbi:hypothetical protein DMA11_16980 [Marinilabiliaceae bacterium JC017]|nr:hypothetical protein DMA11_16980 [Marinilabiliaceae bacterium JC017]